MFKGVLHGGGYTDPAREDVYVMPGANSGSVEDNRPRQYTDPSDEQAGTDRGLPSKPPPDGSRY